MASGIYALEFTKGIFYIGKSNDIDRRWKEHTNKFQKGTAAKAMQYAYARYGMPKFIVVCECHEDHIDLMESMYIRNNWCEGILNTTQPAVLSLEQEEVLRDNENLLKYSTVTHILTILEYVEERRELEYKVTLAEEKYDWLLNIDEMSFVQEAMNKVELANTRAERKERALQEACLEIERYKNMGFWQRLFV